ncbi:hypothetical protein AAD018_014795 [Aestuariibius insulae]|uniref:hypothetical protein n=1 Tax=Aestuariibius insulae TaxID=2058287 RepID=UPI00345EDCD3
MLGLLNETFRSALRQDRHLPFEEKRRRTSSAEERRRLMAIVDRQGEWYWWRSGR